MRRRKINPTPDQLAIRDYQAMLYIEDYYTTHQAVPTVRDVMAALDMSLGGAHDLLDRLVDYGYLQRGRKNCRRNFRILKSVRTGQPVAAHWATLYAEASEPIPDDNTPDANTASTESIADMLSRLPVTLDGHDVVFIPPSRPNLTDPETAAMMFVEDYTAMMGQPPTVREVQDAIEFKSVSGTYKLLKRLVYSGWLYRSLFFHARNWHIRQSAYGR